ncbi:putative homocitrate synthase, mitochondrial precursor [Fusarium bulbicola]|nr:putative homocitrate synthase, mitochondrial precursor [Fusarium bulbicola]
MTTRLPGIVSKRFEMASECHQTVLYWITSSRSPASNEKQDQIDDGCESGGLATKLRDRWRLGITPPGALMARMMPTSRDCILSKYKLHELKKIEEFVAECVEINVPFNNPTTGFCAFTHKAAIHAKAILNDPSTYEILKHEDFGLSRYVHFTSRLTGWNAIKSHIDQLGLKMPDAQVKECTAKLKSIADLKVVTLDESDALTRSFHLELQNENGA